MSEQQMPSSMAAILCIAQEGCCPEHRGAPSCRHGLNMTFEMLRDQAQALGLTYDPVCTAQQQAVVNALACDPVPFHGLPTAGFCSIYYGERDEGESCHDIWRLASDCRQGLACLHSICVEPCGTTPGARLWPYGYACPEGERIDGGECVAGEPPAPCGCGAGAYCKVTWIEGCMEESEACEVPSCEPLVATGEACEQDEACEVGVCVQGVCGPGPGLGESCAETSCALPLACDELSLTCVEWPVVCGDYPR